MHPSRILIPRSIRHLRTRDDTRPACRSGQRRLRHPRDRPRAARGTSRKRDVPITNAAFGMIGLELAVPTMLALVRAGHLTIEQVIDRFSTQPARLWNLPRVDDRAGRRREHDDLSTRITGGPSPRMH